MADALDFVWTEGNVAKKAKALKFAHDFTAHALEVFDNDSGVGAEIEAIGHTLTPLDRLACGSEKRNPRLVLKVLGTSKEAATVKRRSGRGSTTTRSLEGGSADSFNLG
jgi:hypothetical protein